MSTTIISFSIYIQKKTRGVRGCRAKHVRHKRYIDWNLDTSISQNFQYDTHHQSTDTTQSASCFQRGSCPQPSVSRDDRSTRQTIKACAYEQYTWHFSSENSSVIFFPSCFFSLSPYSSVFHCSCGDGIQIPVHLDRVGNYWEADVFIFRWLFCLNSDLFVILR